MKFQDDILNEWTQAKTNILFQLFQSWEQKVGSKIRKYLLLCKMVTMEICSNHLGQEIKRNKSILHGDFMHLSIDNMKY